MLTFTAENHRYESLPDQDPIDWVSGTGLLGYLKNPFDPKQAERSSKSKKSKWYGIPPVTITKLWDGEKDRAANDGSVFHDTMEKKLLAQGVVEREGHRVHVWPCLYDSLGRKLARDQRLNIGSYPEHLMYLKSAGICGQADICERVGEFINIGDYKTNKKLEKAGYQKWDGSVDKMLGPVSHLDDCNWNHYCLQLSLYMYMVLKHNPGLKPGKLTVYHIKFKSQQTTPDPITGQTQDLTDQYDFPIYERDENGHCILEKSTAHDVPYLKKEIEAILKWFTANKHKLPAKAHA